MARMKISNASDERFLTKSCKGEAIQYMVCELGFRRILGSETKVNSEISTVSYVAKYFLVTQLKGASNGFMHFSESGSLTVSIRQPASNTNKYPKFH